MNILKIYYIIFFPLFLIIRFFSKFFLVRFGRISSQRIGHFACTTELYLCEMDHNINLPDVKFFDIFCLCDQISNTQIKIFWEKKLLILPPFLVNPFLFFIEKSKNASRHNVFHRDDLIEKKNFFAHRDTNNLIDKSKIHYSFTEDETKYCNNVCNSIGINLRRKIALINIRDNSYFKKFHTDGDFARWDVKNCDIQNYTKSINYLIKNSYQVIRVGKTSTKNLNLENSNFFDLTNHDKRTDLLESYLYSRCKFLIGSNSGGTYPSIFLYRKPTYISNYIPIGWMWTNSKNIFTDFKKVINNKNKSILTLSELKKYNLIDYQFKEKYDKLNFSVIEHSQDELLDSTDEFMLKVENKWNFTQEEIQLKQDFIKHYKKIDHDSKIHGIIKNDFSYSFLKKNKDWLLN